MFGQDPFDQLGGRLRVEAGQIVDVGVEGTRGQPGLVLAGSDQDQGPAPAQPLEELGEPAAAGLVEGVGDRG
ncbi:hypothetical protein, partial [Virgisporangium ochraceum]|uniref:hypothetical protein n=1 Tax=Virgisporangium ochraceum TaxID=65505 RepID=UPI0019411B5D